MEFRYGLLHRPAGPGCQPKHDLERIEEDPSGKYWNIVVYSILLSGEEIREYEMEFINAD